MGDFTSLLCPVSEDATLYYPFVVEERAGVAGPNCHFVWNEAELMAKRLYEERSGQKSVFAF